MTSKITICIILIILISHYVVSKFCIILFMLFCFVLFYSKKKKLITILLRQIHKLEEKVAYVYFTEYDALISRPCNLANTTCLPYASSHTQMGTSGTL